MQTQGISLTMNAVQSRTTTGSAKTHDSSFDHIMSNNVSNVAERKQPVVPNKRTSERPMNAGKEVDSSVEEYNQHKIKLSDESAKMNDLEQVDVENVEARVVTLLQETFGLSEEEIVDILEQLGLTPMDLALVMSTDSVQISPINAENIRAFVMEVHGIDDANAFLTSATMCQELNDVVSGIQDILAQELGVDVNHFTQEDAMLMQSFAEKWETILNSQQEISEEPMHVETSEMVVDETLGEQEVPVIVEMSSESGTDGASQEMTQTTSDMVHQDSVTQNESPLQAFAEKLSDSIETSAQVETTSSRVTMNSIVEQVVRHVRIRVLPQTTSMELQLNPESLGRVNLTVTSQNGTATATLTVQNEVAKEALESQIAVLKENLENHGLKVESVEVTVSEFGFKNPEDSNSNAFQRKKSNGKRFRLDSTESANDGESVETAEERQDGNSVVDYTA